MWCGWVSQAQNVELYVVVYWRVNFPLSQTNHRIVSFPSHCRIAIRASTFWKWNVMYVHHYEGQSGLSNPIFSCTLLGCFEEEDIEINTWSEPDHSRIIIRAKGSYWMWGPQNDSLHLLLIYPHRQLSRRLLVNSATNNTILILSWHPWTSWYRTKMMKIIAMWDHLMDLMIVWQQLWLICELVCVEWPHWGGVIFLPCSQYKTNGVRIERANRIAKECAVAIRMHGRSDLGGRCVFGAAITARSNMVIFVILWFCGGADRCGPKLIFL